MREEGRRRVQRAPQVQARLGKSDLVISTERVDEGAWLIGPRVNRGVVEVLDSHRPRPWTPGGLSGGWTAGRWRADLLTEGAPRKGSGEASITGRHTTLSHLSAQVLAPLDGREDRRGPRRNPVRQPTYGPGIAGDLQAPSMAMDPWPQDVIRGDATPMAGEHDVRQGGLWQGGPRKEAPRRPPSKVLTGAFAPGGRPLATAGLAGERAAAGVYLPRSERIASGLNTTGRLVGGDWPMRAWSPRASGAAGPHFDRSPLPFPGTTAEARRDWLSAGLGQDSAGPRARMVRAQARGDAVLAAEGSEGARTGGLEAGAADGRERVGGVRSPGHAVRQAAGVEPRLAQAETQLAALTPARGRGKRQRTDAAPRLDACAPGRNAQRGAGWLRLEWAPPRARQTPAVGRGRGAAMREPRGTENLRSPIPRRARRAGPLADRRRRGGWQALVTHATHERGAWAEAVWCDRTAYRRERIVTRLKSRGSIAPRCGKREEHSPGLTYRLTWGVRVFTGLEFVLRRSLDNAHARLPGRHPEKRPKMTDTPTAERRLNACSEVALPILTMAAGEDILPRLTPGSELQQDILQRLGWDTSRYQQRAIHDPGQ